MQAEVTPNTQPSRSAVGAVDRATAKRGLLYQWGPQAWIDMVMSHLMIVRRAWPLVSYTLVPILRMTTMTMTVSMPDIIAPVTRRVLRVEFVRVETPDWFRMPIKIVMEFAMAPQ